MGFAFCRITASAKNGGIIEEMGPALKKILGLCTFFLLIAVFLSFNAIAAADPAAVYCEEMNRQFKNYEYAIKTDANGNQYGECILPDNSKCEEWDFLKGKCGIAQSYCAKKGYENVVKKEGLFCAPKNSKNLNEKEREAFSTSNEKSVEELTNLSSKLGGKIERKMINSVNKDALRSLMAESRQSYSYSANDYPYWDWRNPPAGTQYSSANFSFFDTTQGWVSPVRTQGGCGSCWSFSAHASIEAKYEIVKNNSNLNPDLSEQHSVSCDHTCYTGYSWPNSDCNNNLSTCQCNNGCNGGYMERALKFFRDNGTVDENCFAYAVTTWKQCSARCSDYSQRIWNVSSYATTWPDGGAQTFLTNAEIKQWLLDYGPLSAAVYSGWSLEGDILKCSGSNIPNHGVLVLGYNDTGINSTSYWIIKNSWGTGWSENGYGKVGFNECNINDEYEYATYVNAPANYKPAVILNSPPDNNVTLPGTNVAFNFTVYTRNSTTARCDLIINNSIKNYTSSSVSNASSSVLSYALAAGSYNWSIECWETDLGITNLSESRMLYANDSTPPYIAIISPLFYQNLTSRTISVNLTATDTDAGINYTNITIYNYTNVAVNSVINSTSGNYLQTISVSLDGNYSIYARAYDLAGNTNVTFVNITTDTIPPYVAIASPANTTYNSRSIPLNITSSGAQAVWWFNGTNNLTYSLGYYTFSEGSNTIIAYANDSFGNLNTTSVTFNADTIKPVIRIISPANNSWYDAGRFNASINENGNCSYSMNNGRTNITMNALNGTTFWHVNSSIAAGNYNVTYYCNDSTGNLNSSSMLYFNIDTIAPNITLTSPDDGYSATGTQTIYFMYNVSDNLNLSYCALIIDGTIADYNETALSNGTNDTIAKELGAGSYSWSINCTDYAGNRGNSSTRTLTINSESTPPSSSGGGGGGGGGGTVYYPTPDEIKEGYEKTLAAGDKIEFNISVISAQIIPSPANNTNNKTNGSANTTEQIYTGQNNAGSTSRHSVTIDKIGKNFVNLTIRSNVIKIGLLLGQEAKLNISSADYYDLYIKLESIVNNKANITIKEIREQMAKVIDNTKDSRTGATGTDTSASSGENQTVINSINDFLGRAERSGKVDFISALAIIIVMILFAVYYKEKHELEMNYYYRFRPKKKRIAESA